MSSIDQQFVEFVVKSLVSKPDEVKVERRIDEKGVLLELTVDPEDLGRVIGKRGATAQSLRTLLRALGTKNDARYNLKIVDNGVPGQNRSSSSDDNSSDNNDDYASKNSKKDSPKDDDGDGMIDELPKDEAPDEESVVSKTRKELEDLDDLDV
ncbi:MAG TPA: KH domain-containing protein [Candidatus Saccharimonadales bacterium]|nr:KH domain-containing protein [Candidatus Saccharimonadales bacterium]